LHYKNNKITINNYKDMKKIVFTGVLCFLVSLSFGQKKAVTAAKNALKLNPPNVTDARAQIKEAMANPETANQAETWYVAGQIEFIPFETQKKNELYRRAVDEDLMFGSLERSIANYLKAAELDMLPDEKGNIRPKYVKDIRSIVREHRQYLLNAGIYANEKKDFKRAHGNFKLYGDIPDLELFKGEKWSVARGDTTELQIRYYAGVTASLIPDHKAAASMFRDIINRGYVKNAIFEENELYQSLAQEYNQLEDAESYEKVIKEGFNKFPEDEFYMLNLINICLNAGNFADAISYLEKAIDLNPNNAQLHDVMGQVYEKQNKSDEAIKCMKKALEIEPNNVEYLHHLGRVYFNLGVEKRASTDGITDADKIKELESQSLDFFKEAMPHFEKVFEAAPTNTDAIYALRTIYYNLKMGEKYEKMDALYSKGSEE